MQFPQTSGRKLAGGLGLFGLRVVHLWAVLALYFWFVAQPVAAWGGGLGLCGVDGIGVPPGAGAGAVQNAW
jgi:hypothetical protein